MIDLWWEMQVGSYATFHGTSLPYIRIQNGYSIQARLRYRALLVPMIFPSNVTFLRNFTCEKNAWQI